MTRRPLDTPSRALRGLTLIAFVGLMSACGAESAQTTGGGDAAATDATTRALLGGAPAGGVDAVPDEQGMTAAPAGGADDVSLDLLGFDRGSVEAPVRVVELSDYGCGYCRQFHEETFPSLRAEFIDTGKVQWKFLPYITGNWENSIHVLENAECVLEQSAEGFEVMNSRLWNAQREWKNTEEPAPLVRGWANELDIDMSRYDECMVQRRAVPRMAAATGFAKQVGIRGTPTFFIIGYQPVQGALPLDVFRTVLNEAYEAATAGQE